MQDECVPDNFREEREKNCPFSVTDIVNFLFLYYCDLVNKFVIFLINLGESQHCIE